MSLLDYVWVRVQATCRDCSVVLDFPAFIPRGTRASASVVHSERRHYVDMEVR